MKTDTLKKRQRVAGISAALARGEGVRVSELAASYGVCEKTIRRDLDDMMSAGVELINDHGTWLLVGPPARASSGIDLTMTEAVALCFAVNCYQGIPSPPMMTEVEKAIEKLRQHFPPGFELAAAASHNHYSIALPGARGYEDKQEIVDTIEWALENSLAVRVDYVTQAAADREVRELEPYTLHFSGGHWYLIGRDRVRDEMTMLRMDRISACSELAETFERRPGFTVRGFLDGVWRNVCGGLPAW